MNKTTQEYLEFVENVNSDYYDITSDDEVIPLTLSTCGDYNAVKLDIDTDLFSDNDDNIEDGIKSLDDFIKKIKVLRRVIVKQYCKLSDKQLEYFGVYKDED